MSSQLPSEADEVWRRVLVGEVPYRRIRHIFGLLPTNPRCKLCHAPFQGPGGLVMRVFLDRGPSQLNPNLCNLCDKTATTYQGGAEVEISMLFADVRGSTALAESLGNAEFSQLIGRFYKVATDILVRRDALIEKLIGDEVTGLFVPGFAGPDHAQKAITAARELLQATGHANREGPWVPVGAGVHTGVAYVGSVGSKEGVTDMIALGDAVNTTARLASQAEPGQMIVSDEAAAAADLDTGSYEERSLSLKGRTEPETVHILRIGQDQRERARNG